MVQSLVGFLDFRHLFSQLNKGLLESVDQIYSIFEFQELSKQLLEREVDFLHGVSHSSHPIINVI